ncbi:MAG: ABC transporter substrate-binding protein, partial [Oscillospiraceae bacterium]
KRANTMKKSLSLILALTLVFASLTACAPKAAPEASPSASPEATPTAAPDATGAITLASLKGPTSMGLIKLLDDGANGKTGYTLNSTIYGTADEITGLIANGECDMAAIPANLASVLYGKTKGKIQVAAVNTLGVLNLIEVGDSVKTVADLAGKTVYSTGKGTTPEYVLNAILSKNNIDPATGLTVEFKSEATEIAALLAGENVTPGTLAVLPQPYATTVLMKNPNARIALDLTAEWKNAGLDGELVTGVLVVNSEFAAKNPELVESFLADYEASVSWVNANIPDAAALIAKAGIVPEAKVAEKAIPNCNLVFYKGDTMKTAVSAYLKVLFDQNPKSVGGTLPDENFYLTK